RPAFTTATFAEGVDKISDLEPGMVLEGVVTNVAAFGAFVDVGVHQDGLVHVSAMAKTFVKDPRDVVKPGDVVRVKVLDVDVPRNRIGLTLRLDDMVVDNTAENQSGDRGGRDNTAAKRTSVRDKPAGGSLADALRRAGYDQGSSGAIH
ncbi:MAG: S1 RNA-binding domain-containing protein, partial [Pseudonocardiaceae bacterium]